MNFDAWLAKMDQWLRMNGAPTESLALLQRGSPQAFSRIADAMRDTTVHGGEHLVLGEFDLEIIWTPGHSQGHTCLYEPNRRILLSGDHVLLNITPNVSIHIQSAGNPLADYLNSLQQTAQLPVNLVLPAHEKTFSDLRKRVMEIERHHEARGQAILAAFDGVPKTAYQIAGLVPWSTNGVSWGELSPFVKRMAVAETLAHLEMLYIRGDLIKSIVDGVVWYSASPAI